MEVELRRPTLKAARRCLAQALALLPPEVAPAKLVVTTIRIMNRTCGGMAGGGTGAAEPLDTKDPWVLAAGERVLAAAAEFRDMLRRL